MIVGFYPVVETEEDAATVAELMVDLCIDVVKNVVVFVGIGVAFATMRFFGRIGWGWLVR